MTATSLGSVEEDEPTISGVEVAAEVGGIVKQ
jgi:hypothetical protein